MAEYRMRFKTHAAHVPFLWAKGFRYLWVRGSLVTIRHQYV